MSMFEFLVGALIVVAVLALAWRFSPWFRSKTGKYVDKDGDGKPWR